FENYGVIPDIMTIGKGMASGLPAGAFVAESKVMDSLQAQPEMAHITTFGGNPVIAAAALATLKELLHTDIMPQALKKEALFRKLLRHKLITEIRGKGLMLSLIMKTPDLANKLIIKAQEKRLLLFWLLIEKRAVRITPPLTISFGEIEKGCKIILEILDEIAE